MSRHSAFYYHTLEVIMKHEHYRMLASALLLAAFLSIPLSGSELHEAVQSCDGPRVQQLIASGVAVNESTTGWNTPLHEAVRAGKTQCVFLLLQAGANRYVSNRAGQNAHLLARQYPEPVIRDQLLALIENPENVRQPSESMEDAALRGRTNVVALFLDLGIKPNIVGRDGSTALHNSALKGHTDVVQLLLDHGAGVEVRDGAGYLPLHNAALGGSAAVVRILLDHGASVSGLTRDTDESALHIAAAWGRVDVVRVLLAAGSDKTAKDRKGRTPTEAAAANNQREVVDLLAAGR
jgi:ankyrin repeat protein